MTEKQERDIWVLEVQQWLNKTYGSVEGFGNIIEDGYTGWGTVYGLIRAVQHELGITDLVNNFGATTQRLWDEQVTGKLENGYKSNIVQLIDGAFRCKGFGLGKFTDEYTSENDETIASFMTAAGFETAGQLNSMWAKALFDMSAFSLVPGGDLKTQEMQKDLNLKYSEKTGILPCDGIYQRATNTALIYGVQKEIGLWEIANGNFGPKTQEVYGTLASSHQVEVYPNLMKLIQYALYQNLRTLMNGIVTFSSEYDDATQTSIVVFQSFLNIYDDVEIGYPDLTTMMSLMLSSGSADRSFPAVDTAEQLTPEQIKTLADSGVKYVGRYLTGTVGNEFVPKNLTLEEANNIIQSGMAIIPLYQDNNPLVEYYTLEQGMSDAMAAFDAAEVLGFEQGTIIYFAVDVDALDGDIITNIIPYFQGIKNEFTRLDGKYRAGVYGTRNVCIQVKDTTNTAGSYVSNMSTGWSGNLGFSQPTDWMFDQFNEPSGGIGTGSGAVSIDKVNSSGFDTGVTSVKYLSFDYAMFKRLGSKAINELLESESFEFGFTFPIWKFGPVEVDMTLDAALQAANPNANLLHASAGIKNGKLDKDISAEFESVVGSITAEKVEDNLIKLTQGVETGGLEISVEYVEDKINISVVINMIDFNLDGEQITTSVKYDIKIEPNYYGDKFKKIFDALMEANKEAEGLIWLLIFLGVLVGLAVAGPAYALTGGVAAIALMFFETLKNSNI